MSVIRNLGSVRAKGLMSELYNANFFWNSHVNSPSIYTVDKRRMYYIKQQT